MGEPDQTNEFSAYWYALSKDTPAKTWWRCPPMHDSVYSALGIRKSDTGAIYACAPFRRHPAGHILAAYPAPRLFDEPDHNWLGIETVIEWHPGKDAAEVVGDPTPQIVGHMTEEANGLFSSPRRFFQQWAAKRAQFAVQRQNAAKGLWHIAPAERDEIPGGLVIGATADIRWHPSAMPTDIQCFGLNPTIINKAILRAARLPRARGGTA
ncbi:hypothetical protein [Novosphingobium sp. KN65.2]|uniref:hypothetical protein n=1 Tax=Novosphingobium sp. KN65.2 TaxID=1478134 RepID=UPI0005DD4914|nr:hypothetical protein [Novosphingobium sp. KN65.2]CDO38914.1 hypothetical protein SPHV1_820002 [Novosphingobium sp. KN65.2]